MIAVIEQVQGFFGEKRKCLENEKCKNILKSKNWRKWEISALWTWWDQFFSLFWLVRFILFYFSTKELRNDVYRGEYISINSEKAHKNMLVTFNCNNCNFFALSRCVEVHDNSKIALHRSTPLNWLLIFELSMLFIMCFSFLHRISKKTATRTYHVHEKSARNSRRTVLQNSLPGHLHERRCCYEDKSPWIQSTGEV